jgi:hypothetical protein
LFVKWEAAALFASLVKCCRGQTHVSSRELEQQQAHSWRSALQG